jgi:hypothetical protein
MYPNYGPFLIPIVALVGAFAVAIVTMILKSHARDRQHRERMFMAEKGLEVPKELYDQPEPEKPNDYRSTRALLMVFGWIIVGVGLSVLIALSVRTGIHEGIYGIIPLFIGLGFLLSERMIARTVAKRNGQ